MILGLNAYHADASAALYIDGDIVAAVEEERFTRVKHAGGLPVEAMRWVLEQAGASPRDIEHVAVSKSPHAHRARRVREGVLHTLRSRQLPLARLRARSETLSIGDQVRGAFRNDIRPDVGIHYVEHHPAHIASAFFASDFDEAAVCSIDGLGDLVSMAWGTGRGRRLDVDDRVFFPHSLGFFYTAITQYLGFPHYGDEYKVMGLAPYGTPKYLPEMRRILTNGGSAFELELRYFRHASENVRWEFDGGAPVVGALYSPRLEELLGPIRAPSDPIEQRHRDIAASAQVRLEEVLLPMLDRLQRATGQTALTMAGGVALNVTTNSKVLDATNFKEVYIQPAAGDAGTSLGSALFVAHHLLGSAREYQMQHVYLGPAFSSGECADALENAGLSFVRLEEADLCRRTAELLAQGKIVGWFQGRMEYGPRALGNRSILCDPRGPHIKDLLNRRTKRRESFRPFAPSVLAERVSDIYEYEGESPFMLFAPKAKPEWVQRLPAVTHVDGTGRIQTVHRETNERYWKLLRAFESLTGVPVLLNTSFNENEPIVCRPEEAIACFLRADMDVLVLEDLLVVASEASPT